jgi:hypothetical protein
MAVTAQIRLSWRGRALSISSFLSPARCPPHIVKLPREPPPLVILQVKEVSRQALEFESLAVAQALIREEEKSPVLDDGAAKAAVEHEARLLHWDADFDSMARVLPELAIFR